MATEYTAGNGLDDEARREFEKERALMNKALGMSPGDTEDNCRWAAFYLSGKLGINSVDGAIYNNRQPMAPRDYLKKMQEVWKARDISTLYDDEAKGYRAIDGEAPDALEQRYAYAMQHANNSVGNRLGTMASRAVARDRITADELEWLTDEERKEAGKWDPEMRVGEDAAQVIGDLENEYGAGFFHEGAGLSDDILARRASLRGRSVEAERAEYERAIRTAREAFPLYEDKATARARRDAARPHVERLKDTAEKRRAVAAYEKKLSEQNAWQTVLAGKQLLSEEGQAIVDMAEAHKDDLVGAVGEKFRELQRRDPKEAATLAAIIHALQPSADDNTVAGDAMRAFGRMMFETPVGALKTVVNVVERQIVGGEEYQRRREAEAEWRRAFEPMQKEHDFWGNAVVGFAGTIPYSAYAALPGGTAAVALSAANDFERQIVDQGGDISSQEFQFARIAVGFGYAAIEKAQVIHPFRSIENRAWAHLYGTMTESVMSFLKTAGHQGMRYLGELGEEGLQGAVGQGFVAWGLGKDVAAAAAKGLVEEAWGAIGPFAPLMALEAGSAKATYRRGGFNAADMARQKLILDGLKDRAATAMDAANYGKAYGAIAQTWASMGENAALRQNELMRRYGVTADEALSMDQALGKMWAAVNGDANAERKFMGGAKVKSAAELLSEVFTDAKVESRENGSVVFSGKIGDTGNEVRFLIGKSDTVLDTEDRSQWESIVSAVNGSIDGDKSGKAAEALAGMADGAKRMTIPEWEHLTPEARQAIADFFGLSVRGGIKSRVQRIKVDTSAADGSTEESDIDTTAFYLVSGKIDLTQNALPQAVFHEAMHSMIGFAGQMARAGDENAQAVLSALAEAYPALSGREGLDEESIANGYRDYLTGKIPLVEVQKSAFDKFFEFVGKWLGMIDNTGERALTVANAQSAMNVFFNDVLTGNFSAIEDAGRLADVARARNARIQKERIERTEREAAAPTEATGESARTADEKFGGAIVAAEDELVDESGETIPPDKVAEAAAQGKAIMKRSEYERRKAEGVGVGAHETDEERRERIKREETVFEGTDEQGRATVKTPDGAMEIETRLAVIDRDDLLTSDKEGYPQEYQDKISRDKGAGGAQIEKIGRAPNSGMLGASETSDLGAPIVWRDADGRLVVIAGNGRVLGLRAGDEKYNSTGNYDDFARRTGERYGIQVPEGMAHPTLVRVIETDLTRDQLVKFALASNKSTLQEKNDADNMRSDGLRIDADMAAKISTAPDAGLMDPRNAEFVNAFLASANGGALTGADGQLNATGVRRLRDALLGALLVRHPAANEVITILQDPRNDLGIGNVVEGIKDAAIHLVALRGREEWADYDLSDDIADALNDYIDFKRSGYSDIEDYLGQGDFLRNRPSLTAAILRELFARRNSAQRVADILNAYAKTAMLQDDTGPALFDMGVTPRETVWKLAVEKADARDAARHSVEAARWSIETNPNLLGDIKAALIRRTKEAPNVEQKTRRHEIVFSNDLPFFDFLGLPNEKVVSDVVHVRKFAAKHKLSAEQIAELPSRYNAPVAVFRDGNSAYTVLTDLMTENDAKARKPVMIRLTQSVGRDGERMFLASAYARESDTEDEYRRLANTDGAALFLDENKVAALALEQGTTSTLLSLADRDDVLTAEDYSLWSTRNSIAQSSENVKGGRNSIEAEAQRQYDEVVARYTNPDGTRKPGWMTAPNGKPTKLTERQWVQVRTPYFKEWFGDWENDPENASKVVDENGEPMVVAHSTDARFTTFRDKQKNDAGWLGAGFYFFGDRTLDGQYGRNVMECFLNVRDPHYLTNEEHDRLVEADDTNVSEEFADELREEGNDGVYWNGDLNMEWAVFAPAQIKSATDNVGTFDAGNPDIRYSVEPLGTAASFEERAADAKANINAAKTEAQRVLDLIHGTELGNAVNKDFKGEGQTTIIGRTVRTAGDLAAAAQIYRNPCFETFRYFFTRGDKIVWQTSVTSRMPGSTPLSVGRRDTFLEILRMAEAMKPDGMWVLHNHPSGSIAPSRQDIESTGALREWARVWNIELKGHVIIDHDKYAFIDEGPFGQGRERDFSRNKASFHGEPAEPGVRLTTAGSVRGVALAAVAAQKAATNPGEALTIVAASARMEVRSVATVPTAEITGGLTGGILDDYAAATGGMRLFLVGDIDIEKYPADVRKELIGLCASGIVTDFIYPFRQGNIVEADSAFRRRMFTPKPHQNIPAVRVAESSGKRFSVSSLVAGGDADTVLGGDAELAEERVAELLERAGARYSVESEYDPRSRVPSVRGGWTEKKILRYLKEHSSLHGLKTAAKLIAEFDTVDELKNHMFYHGTRHGVDRLSPSITKSERWAEANGGGGYGQRYWGISVSKSKKVASVFGNPSPGVSIYPIVLAKGAKVVDRPDLHDADEVEDHIVELWNEGVDAVRLGDWTADTSEQELLVLNPRSICNIGSPDTYRYFNLGTEKNPIDIKDDAHIARMLEMARDYAGYSPEDRFGKPRRPSLFEKTDGSPENWVMKPAEQREQEKAEWEEAVRAWAESEQGRAAWDYEAKARSTLRFSVESRSINLQALPDSAATVETSTSVAHLKKHPDYEAAKRGGDMRAAGRVVRAMLKDETVERLRKITDPDKPVLLPMFNREGTSINRLPIAYAQELAKRLGGRVETRIAKTSKEHNTGASMEDRRNREFEFEEDAGSRGAVFSSNDQIILVDDTWTSGQTMASAADFILQNYPGAKIAAITTLAFSRYGKNVKATPEQLTKALNRANIDDVETANRLLGFNLAERATGSEIHAYIIGGKRGRKGFLEHFSPAKLGGVPGDTAGGRPGDGGVERLGRRGGLGSMADALPGDASQYSIVAQNPLGGLSRDSIVVAMAAQDKLRGLSRPPELYAELAAALHANIDPATIQAEADKLIAGNRERLSKTVEQDAAAATRETAAMFDRANFSRHVADLFSGSATFGSDIGGAATEGWHRILRDLMARAPGYDLDALRLDTGADLTKTLMEILPEVFAPSEKEGGGGEDEGGRNAPGKFVGPPTAETWATWNESAIERRRRYSEIIARVKAELLARQAKIKEREEAKARRAEEARHNAEAENGNGDDAAARAEREADREAGIDENDADETLDSVALPREVVEGFGVDLANADEFASFMRAWVCDWLARKNPGTTYADVLDDPVALATYRRTMIAQLRDIANALLDPTEGKAAIMAERMISDIRDDAGADELERRTSDIIGFIQRNAIRQKRKSLIKETLDMIELMAVRGRKFDALERDMKRKILGEHEAYARYIAKVILMSDGAIQRETERLNAIIEGRRAKYGDAEAELGEALNWESDAEIHKAMEQLAALQQYGGLKNKMPSHIVAAKKQLEAWLGGEREAHERRWGEFQAACDEVAETIAEGVRKGRGKYAPDKLGLKGKIYEDVVASVRQRLEDMLVGAGTAERREAIGRVMRLLSEGSQQRESLRHRYRRQFEAALVDAAKGTELDAKGLLRKLEEQIPEELNDLLDSEVADADGNPIHARQRVRMTWGQAMQLYASLMQTATYGENIVLHQRRGQVEAIRNAAHPAMLKLVSNLRTIYGGRREELSNTVRQVTGMPIYNPDPLYMPAKMLAGQREGLDAKGYAWSPLSKSLTPRVKNRRDFDLSADLLATYQGRTHDAVEAISFGVRGIALRSMLTRKAVVEAMAQSVGKERTRRLIEQVTDTLTDGYAIDEQRGGIMGLVRATGTATTYAALSFNLVTALKQMQSVSAWAPMLDGGYLEIGRHVANFDREAARELMNSPGFVARYGASGFAEMMRAALDDTEGTLIARLFRLGMTAVQIGDFVPGIVVGQGVYKARWQALMRQNPGMAAEAAKEQAATETWALIEECQQTSRLENTPHMLRRWGVMGRQVSKFATAPLQQVAHEIHTFKMWREAMAAGNAATAEEYRRKFVNTLISNHVLMPAAFYAVATLFGMALGDEPPEDEELFGDLLVQMVAGPWARLFFAGAVIENAVAGGARLTGLKPHVYPHADFPAAATVKRIMDKGFLTARDVAEADWRTVADDLLDEISIVNAPVRYATKGLRNWTGYDAAQHRREARKARAGK